MKIEIAESLVSSWFKHVNKCVITQSNWKTAITWGGEIDDCLEFATKELIKEFGDGLFKKNSGLKQIIKQGELDCVGFNFKSNEVFMAEVAFHADGLNYGSTDITILNIVKKLCRAAFIWHIYFRSENQCTPRISFITPKAHNVLEANGLMIKLRKAEEIISRYLKHEIFFDFISNARFYDEVYRPVIEISKDVSDTNELFVRGYQLSKLVEKNVVSDSIGNSKRKNISGDKDSTTISDEALIAIEVSKVRNKIPKWFRYPNQINSRILISFLDMHTRDKKVTYQELADKVAIPSFDINFNQMKIIAERNHAKVFEINGEIVELWGPVSEFILSEYQKSGASIIS